MMTETLCETVSCSLCGADDYTVIYPSQLTGRNEEELIKVYRSSGDERLVDQLVRCNHCGLQYLNPRLRQDKILEGYQQGEDQTFISQADNRERTFNRSLNLIEKFTEKGSLLDVGTAGGSFLSAARKRGWAVSGCEPNEWLARWGSKEYGVTITPGTLFDLDLPDQSQDMVTLWDVLEHTPDPKKVLQECHRLLKPDGVLVINYPDVGSWVSRAMGRRWVFLLSVHLYYFTAQTITEMLAQTGFSVIKRKMHWQSLELDYILTRMKAYVPILPDLMQKCARFLRIQHMSIPYWMGQTLVLARAKNIRGGNI